MRPVFLLSLGASLLIAPIAVAEEWTSGFGQGFAEHIIRHGPGNSFNISCDEGYSEKQGQKTSIYIEIAGRSPPPHSEVNVVLDGNEYQLQTDDSGSINLDCHVCYDNYYAMWKKMLSAKTMLVQYPNHTSVKFDMKGARKVLGPKVCKTPWDAF